MKVKNDGLKWNLLYLLLTSIETNPSVKQLQIFQQIFKNDRLESGQFVIRLNDHQIFAVDFSCSEFLKWHLEIPKCIQISNFILNQTLKEARLNVWNMIRWQVNEIIGDGIVRKDYRGG